MTPAVAEQMSGFDALFGSRRGSTHERSKDRSPDGAVGAAADDPADLQTLVALALGGEFELPLNALAGLCEAADTTAARNLLKAALVEGFVRRAKATWADTFDGFVSYLGLSQLRLRRTRGHRREWLARSPASQLSYRLRHSLNSTDEFPAGADAKLWLQNRVVDSAVDVLTYNTWLGSPREVRRAATHRYAPLLSRSRSRPPKAHLNVWRAYWEAQLRQDREVAPVMLFDDSRVRNSLIKTFRTETRLERLIVRIGLTA